MIMQATAKDEGTMEFERARWASAMEALAEALQERGRAVPPGYRVDLARVPEGERDERGLPRYRAVLTPDVTKGASR